MFLLNNIDKDTYHYSYHVSIDNVKYVTVNIEE